MPNIVCINLQAHKTNLPEAIDRAIKSQAKTIVFVGLDLALVQQAFDAGREVAVLPVGSPVPKGAVEIPCFPGTERSKAFIIAQEIVAARSKRQ